MIKFDHVLDAKGLSCPMPIIKARQAMKELGPGQVLKVISTDRGSVKDFQGWAKTSKELALVAQEEEQHDEETLYVHYLEKKA